MKQRTYNLLMYEFISDKTKSCVILDFSNKTLILKCSVDLVTLKKGGGVVESLKRVCIFFVFVFVRCCNINANIVMQHRKL